MKTISVETGEFAGWTYWPDEPYEARGDVLRAGGSLVFVRGFVTAEGRPCLRFSGTIKRVRPKG